MHDGLDLIQGINEAFAYGEELVEGLYQAAHEAATAEQAYRSAKKKRVLYERASGTPVTIIEDVVKGYEDISTLDVERKCAEAKYTAQVEAIRLNNRRIDFYRQQIDAEERQVNRNE